MKKIVNILIIILICLNFSFGEKAAAITVNKVIADSGINKSAVSVSVKDVETGKVIFELNEKQPMIPASTLKLITFSAAYDTLGEDYEFKTSLYKTKNNELILKLGADPYLKTGELNDLIKEAKAKNIIEPKAFFIDDSILDNNEWGEGWQWDDDLNPLMPKFSSYNLDGNMLSVVINPNAKGSPATIYTTKFYPTTFMNLVVTDAPDKVTFIRQNHISPDMITVEGSVSKTITEKIPVNNPKRYFILRLEEAIRNEKIEFYDKFKQKKLPKDNIYLVKEIKHTLPIARHDIITNSSNFVAETVYKIAGGKFANDTGSQENSLKMFNEFCKKEGLDASDIRVVDGSGTSKNNIMTADFMTSFLINRTKKDHFKELKNALPTPGEGTLSTRMLYFKDNLRAKTGTLSDVSCLAGYITTRNGKLYAFDIMINDPKTKNADKKTLEEHILRAIHSSY